jgi:hypothetical protein
LAHYMAGELTLSGWGRKWGEFHRMGRNSRNFRPRYGTPGTHTVDGFGTEDTQRWYILGGSQKKRCRLSWLTNSALVYEPKYVGGWVAGFQLMSTAVHVEPK